LKSQLHFSANEPKIIRKRSRSRGIEKKQKK
jgi:hypothetical protein